MSVSTDSKNLFRRIIAD